MAYVSDSRYWAKQSLYKAPGRRSCILRTIAGPDIPSLADVQDAIQTAVGANAVTQVQQGEARFDVTIRYQQQYRDTREAIESVRLLAPSGERVSLAQLTTISTDDGAEQINREGGQRYIAIKYSAKGRDLGSTVEEAISKVEHNVQLPTGYHLEWAGEYESKKRANKRMALIVPITVLAIFLILYTMFRSTKWAVLILVSVVMASIGGPLALFITHTNFSVSSASASWRSSAFRYRPASS